MKNLKGKKIAVIVGGPSTEAAVSRNSGKNVAAALRAKGYDPIITELVPEEWARTLKEGQFDIVFNALHGRYGEDGVLQGTCEMMNVPYTGPGVMASAVGMNKVVSKSAFVGAGISTAPFRDYFEEQGVDSIAEEILKVFSLPVVIKSAAQGSSIGTVIVRKKDDLKSALSEAFAYGKSIVAEAFLAGREFTVAVMDELAFPVIEIISKTGRYDYESKYTPGLSEHICPAQIPPELTKELQDLSLAVFRLFHCKGVARVDLMTDENGKAYVLEINTVPGMTETSLVPDASRAMGMPFEDLCERILEEASTGKF